MLFYNQIKKIETYFRTFIFIFSYNPFDAASKKLGGKHDKWRLPGLNWIAISLWKIMWLVLKTFLKPAQCHVETF